MTRHAGALGRQGSVQRFYRQRGSARCGPYYRVVLRSDGQQRTHYLGKDPAFAEVARGELDRLQRGRTDSLERRRRLKRYRATLREARNHIRGLLAERGLELKGWELRRVRALRAGRPGTSE